MRYTFVDVKYKAWWPRPVIYGGSPFDYENIEIEI